MLNFIQIKEMIKEKFESINITFNSSSEITIFDPKSPDRKIIGEKNCDHVEFFEIVERQEPGFEEEQKSIEFQVLGNSKNVNFADLLSLV